jgi:pyruvate/2-oxoglutarate dehydrogenase complex dihydrolipoamide acyltransferase (E2) component
VLHEGRCCPTYCSPKPDATAEHTAGASQQQHDEQQPAEAEKASGVMGPAARLLLQRAGLSADDVRPTGPNGIITKVCTSDILQRAHVYADS